MSKQLDIILQTCIKLMGEGITDPSRKRDNVFKRAVYYKCCTQLTKESYVRIGKSLGKDHATVIHGLRIFDNDIMSNNFPNYLELYRDCIRMCSLRLNKTFLKTSDKKEMMGHIIINQRHYIKQLEKLLDNIPQSVKMKYA